MMVAGLRSLPSFLCVCAAGQELHEEIKNIQVLDYEARIRREYFKACHINNLKLFANF